jgi:acyl-homoserine lactone acylase PvdQ
MHPANELIQVLNPEQGYMQNCNVPPDAMMPGSPFSIDDYPSYIYSSAEYGSRLSGWTTQRGARAIQLLQADEKISVIDAIHIINDISPFGTDRWIRVLKMAAQKYASTYEDNNRVQTSLAEIFGWDLTLANSSAPALKYFYWRQQMDEQFSVEVMQQIKSRIDDWYAGAAARPAREIEFDELPLQEMLNAFVVGLANLEKIHGTITAVWGDRFRVGRGDRSWPVEGGGAHDTRTLRSMGYDKPRADGTQWGVNGQTSTQVVSLTRPIQSWGYLPLGESDRQDSPHFDDQAEKLFSTRTLTSSWWMPAQLMDHIESRKVLSYPK